VTNRNRRTLGGLAGRLVNRAKEALASASGNQVPAPEGHHHEARSDSAEAAGTDANERASAAGADPGAGGGRGADGGAGRRYTGAERSVRAAERVRLAATEEANRLEREAREAARPAEHRGPEKGT
jgi:hypothetical protein